jgi:hypothetical protein
MTQDTLAVESRAIKALSRQPSVAAAAPISSHEMTRAWTAP